MPQQSASQLEGLLQLVHQVSSWAHPVLPKPGKEKVEWILQKLSALFNVLYIISLQDSDRFALAFTQDCDFSWLRH